MNAILEKITEFADNAHGDQQRKYAEERYIEHPLRVMRICKSYEYPLPVLAAAILHDVLEDTPTTAHQIKDFLVTVMDKADADHTLDLVIELTDVYIKQQHPGFNRKKRKALEAERLEKTSAEAQTIKYADIIDNAREIADQDADFAPVFLRECKLLVQKMTNGNPDLRKEAIEVLRKGTDLLRTHKTHS